MNELIGYALVLVFWYVLQMWILPKMGIPTCMSGACKVPVKAKNDVTIDEESPKQKK